MIKRNKIIAKIMILAVCASIFSCTGAFATDTTLANDEIVTSTVEDSAQAGYYTFDPLTGTILEANIIKPDGMTNVIIPDTIKGVTVTNIGDYAFSTFANQTSIREVKLPTTIKNIGECAFANCSNLRKLVINSENLSNIGEYAFYKCSKLSEVTLPDSLKTIDNHAFGYCTKLTSIDVPDGINTVSRNSFEHISEYALFNVSSIESKDVLIKAGILEDKINYTAE